MMVGVGIGAAEEKEGGAVKGKVGEVIGAPAMREPKDVGLVLSGAKKVGGEAGAADLGVLGQVVNGAEDRGMTPDMKGRAQALAHYSAALQAEVAGDMAKAFEHDRAGGAAWFGSGGGGAAGGAGEGESDTAGAGFAIGGVSGCILLRGGGGEAGERVDGGGGEAVRA